MSDHDQKTDPGVPTSEEVFSGPVFEPGPGWGDRVSKWLKRHFFKYVLPVAAIVAAIGVYSFLIAGNEANNGLKGEENKNQEELAARSDEAVKVIVEPKAGFIRVARAGLNMYLQNKSDVASRLTAAHRVFIEQELYNRHKPVSLTVGQTVEFKVSEMEEIINQALALTPAKLQRWQEYVR